MRDLWPDDRQERGNKKRTSFPIVSSPRGEMSKQDDTLHYDSWGDVYISPTKEKREFLKSKSVAKELSTGPLFKSLNSVLFRVFHVQPKSLALLAYICNSLVGIGRVLFNLFVAFLNPWENFLDRKWPSINIFTGAIYVPKFNMAAAFPYWFRPIEIKRLEWDAIRLLISLSSGVHIAVDVQKLNVGLILEEVVRDRAKHRRDERKPDLGFDKPKRMSPKKQRGVKTPERVLKGQKEQHEEVAKQKVAHFSTTFRRMMENLKKFGINIAINFDEIGVGMEFTKLELDGTITTSDDWWKQGTHIRALDVGMTLSTGRSASFLSWEVMELRFLEEEDSDLEEEEEGEEEEEEENYADAFFDASGTAAGGGGSGSLISEVKQAESDDELQQVQENIARQLFDDNVSTDSGDRALQSLRAQTTERHTSDRRRNRKKDHFARALEDPPLFSLSAFSCGANVFLELAEMDFSSRSAMMARYGEIKRIYRQSNQYSASGPVGTSPSAHFARRKHAHLRGELPGDAPKGDDNEDEEWRGVVTRREEHKLDAASRVWGLSMSAVAISMFYAYAKANKQ